MFKLKFIKLPNPDLLIFIGSSVFLLLFPLWNLSSSKLGSREITGLLLWYLMVCSYLFPIFWEFSIKKTKIDWFSPVMFNLYTTFFGIFRPLFIINDHWKCTWMLDYTPDYVSGLVMFGLLCMILHNIFYYFGYYWKKGAVHFAGSIRPLNGNLNQKKVKTIAVIIIAICMVLFLDFLRQAGSIQSLLNDIGQRREAYKGKQYQQLGILLMPLGVWILFSYNLTKKNKVALFPIITVIVSVILAAMFGGRGNMAVLVLITIVIIHYTRYKFSVYELIAIFVLAVPFFSMYKEFRIAQRDSEQFTTGIDAEKEKKPLVEVLFNEEEGFDRFVRLLHGVPEYIPFQYFTTYTRVLTVIVPRALWPGKPALSEAAVYAPLFLRTEEIERKEMDKGVYPAGSVGDYYLQCGIAGVIIMAFLRGLLSRIAYEYLLGNIRNSNVVVFYGIALSSNVFKLRNLFIVGFLFRIIPFFMILLLCRKNRPRAMRTLGLSNGRQ